MWSEIGRWPTVILNSEIAPYKPWSNKLFQAGYLKSPPRHQKLIPFLSAKIQDDILFKGSQIVLLTVLRREMLLKIHEGHLGVESCLRRARELFYWPRMSSEIKDYVSNCSVCNITQHPWSKVATDLFSINGDNFVVIVDYYSNFIEVEQVRSTASRPVTSPESDIQTSWYTGLYGIWQWASICLSRISGVCKTVGAWSYHYFSTLSSI